MAIEKIISGGQTGVDRAALEWALDNGFAIGGYCPRGFFSEDGQIPERLRPYLTEYGKSYPPRTRKNVREADATLIFWAGKRMSRGTELTYNFVKKNETKGYALVHFGPDGLEAEDRAGLRHVVVDLVRRGVRVLNVAGPRESSAPGIYAATRRALDLVVDVLREG